MTIERSKRGAVARKIAGAEAVEIKATLPGKQIKGALARYQLDATGDAHNFIYFFDTPDLTMFQTGLIARARRRVGSEHDSTVKFRPIDPDAVPKIWRKHEGFKIEADASRKGIVVSGSLTMPVEKGLIRKVAGGTKKIPRLFDEEQQAFLLSLAKRELEFTKVVALGPVQAWRWKFSDPGLPWPLTAELWRRDDGAKLFEVSIKVPAVQAAAAGAGFMAFMAEVGAQRDEGQQAKTRWALEFYAAQHKGPAPTARPRPKRKRVTARSSEAPQGQAATPP